LQRKCIYGIPCRHELAICILLLKDHLILYFEKRWRCDYFIFEEVEVITKVEEGEKLNEDKENKEELHNKKSEKAETHQVIIKENILILLDYQSCSQERAWKTQKRK